MFNCYSFSSCTDGVTFPLDSPGAGPAGGRLPQGPGWSGAALTLSSLSVIVGSIGRRSGDQETEVSTMYRVQGTMRENYYAPDQEQDAMPRRSNLVRFDFIIRCHLRVFLLFYCDILNDLVNCTFSSILKWHERVEYGIIHLYLASERSIMREVNIKIG